jgi:hypothetical protein
MQVAIWELVYDQTSTDAGYHNVSDGHIKFANDTAVALAQTWINGLGATGDPTATDVLALISTGVQDQSFIISAAHAPDAPLPPVAWGGISLFGAMIVGKVRSRRKHMA